MSHRAFVPLKTRSVPSDPESPYVLSYFALRRAAGWIGIVLPFVVFFFNLSVHHCVPQSISASYYTGARNYFVGSLCAVGVFLVCSVGYKEDTLWSIFAGAMAFLVAFCPTRPGPCSLPNAHVPFPDSWVIHMAAAIALFLTFAIFCLFLFTRSSQSPGVAMPKLSTLPDQKKKRNVVFIVCGSGMLVCMAALAVAKLMDRDLNHYEVLIVEWLCLLLFGIAWIVKGQQIYADIDPTPAPSTAAQNLSAGLPANEPKLREKLD